MTVLHKYPHETSPLYGFHCPGCGYTHTFRCEGEGPKWDWNGDMDRPTVSPSILVRATYRCHSFVREGKIQFLSDCDHNLAGQTIDLPQLDHDGDPLEGDT